MTEQKVIPLRARRAPVSENPASSKPDTKPAPKRRAKAKAKPKRETWTAEMKRTFLANLAATANVQASIRSIGMSESAVYRLRQRSPEFRAEWMAALREGYLPTVLDAAAAEVKWATCRSAARASFRSAAAVRL